MDKLTLLAAIKNSGGAEQPDVDALRAKLAPLDQTNRYSKSGGS